jgi:hypothetical protein
METFEGDWLVNVGYLAGAAALEDAHIASVVNLPLAEVQALGDGTRMLAFRAPSRDRAERALLNASMLKFQLSRGSVQLSLTPPAEDMFIDSEALVECELDDDLEVTHERAPKSASAAPFCLCIQYQAPEPDLVFESWAAELLEIEAFQIEQRGIERTLFAPVQSFQQGRSFVLNLAPLVRAGFQFETAVRSSGHASHSN